MNKEVAQVYQSVQKLIGLHRQLLDNVRLEHEALVGANLKGIQSVTASKQALIESIQLAETERLRFLGELALLWKKPMRELTLINIGIAIQVEDPKGGEQLRTAFNVLTVLIKRISEQNDLNRSLVEKSLEHIQAMKRNTLSASAPRTDVYNQQGKRESNSGSSRLLSKEI